MELSVRDAAQAFGVSEPTILRWVEREALPAFVINGRYRFNRVDLLEWSSAKRRPLASGVLARPASPARFGLLRRALEAGGVHRAVAGEDAPSALAAAAGRLPLSKADRALAAEVLADREKGGTTAIGEGIAIPHPRSPLVFPVAQPTAALCFLERPADFGAADGKPVEALFLLLAPTVRMHLALLAELAGALHERDFKDALARRASAEELLALLAGKA